MVQVSLIVMAVAASFSAMPAPSSAFMAHQVGNTLGGLARRGARRTVEPLAPMHCAMDGSREKTRYKFGGSSQMDGRDRDEAREGAGGDRRRFMFVPYGEKYIKQEGETGKSICADGLVLGTS